MMCTFFLYFYLFKYCFINYFFFFFFIFSSIRRHTRLTCDWSSDVCSSDLLLEGDRRLRRALDRVDLLGLDARYLGDLLRGRLTAQLGDQLALRAADLVELLDDVHREIGRASGRERVLCSVVAVSSKKRV